MAMRESEAIVLRSYPLREADLLVTLFTRAEGKVRGVARSAKKSKRRFGGALEPLTYVRAFYDVRERQELARLDACEVLESPMASEVSYARAVALGHIAELLDELLPDREANDAIFRLALSVLHVLPGPDIWMPVTYFELWLTRLVGFLPELTECIVCGRGLNGSHVVQPLLTSPLPQITHHLWLDVHRINLGRSLRFRQPYREIPGARPDVGHNLPPPQVQRRDDAIGHLPRIPRRIVKALGRLLGIEVMLHVVGLTKRCSGR